MKKPATPQRGKLYYLRSPKQSYLWAGTPWLSDYLTTIGYYDLVMFIKDDDGGVAKVVYKDLVGYVDLPEFIEPADVLNHER